jgi:uncharacterized protein YdeI (YjbR/CyaY-like superfamily)
LKPKFLATPSEFRAWLKEHHDTSTELLVGYYKKGSGRPSITWQESVDEALCFGWIDGVRKTIDDERYTIRFSPRKARSNWSAVNIKRAKELIGLGLMRPAGLKAFESRPNDRSAMYSYEQRHSARLDKELEREFRRNKKAWEFFLSKPPSYRKGAIYWVMSAKKEETRRRRLATLIEDSAQNRTVGPLTPPAKRK